MKLLLTGAFHYSETQIERLKTLGFDIVFVADERGRVPDSAAESEYVICNALFQYNDIAAFKKLKYIQLTSAGRDRVPLGYITAHGITLKTAGNAYSVPMAEWAIAKILELYKQTRRFYDAQQRKAWEKIRDLPEVYGKTAVIIGFGNVGTELAARLRGFGVNIIAVGTRKPKIDMYDKFCAFENIDNALAESDIIALTLPLTEQTRGLFSEKRFSVIKPGAVLVNVARGGLIDEKALLKALDSGILSGAALDVFETEPLPKESPLWERNNVLITPHNAFLSNKTADRLFALMLEHLKGETLH
ncbi:MAG: hydroxyacid dehydrogenase [Clostridiales bacterium]|jgi:phosphoglycerate dehydrogenase-like enzyme|nr:hydroxyacid dehydrogenase [Clostridiales bacterium]